MGDEPDELDDMRKKTDMDKEIFHLLVLAFLTRITMGMLRQG